MERLSGGERRRLELVALIARGGNLLVLDEPTNHLDAESREALEAALEAYDGTILMVSHDRALIDAIATHTLAIEDGGRCMRGRRLHGPGARARGRGGAGAAGAPRRAGARAPGVARAPGPRRAGCARGRPAGGAHHRARDPHRGGRGGARRPGRCSATASAWRPAARSHRSLQEELSWLMREWEQAAEAAS